MAKAAFSVDQLSNGRLILGIVSGDRLIEYPTYEIDFEIRDVRFRESLNDFCKLTESFPKYHSNLDFQMDKLIFYQSLHLNKYHYL